ncbi:MAG: hypothetical protein KIT11_11680 [Fimbriimonadaceae bacterium]|nr:hypothetical protein [Fimbriimonadaceae bacterium]QYK55306.1 MAG: hypothetical protein KF733_09855 [Fimbriimonadaceae bacterium]
MRLQESDYFSYLATCLMTGWALAKFEGEVYDGESFVANDKSWHEYHDALSAHHIGISGIFVTSDFKIIVQVQTIDNTNDVGDLVPSSSGSLDLSDIARETFDEAIFEGILREGVEELGVSRSLFPRVKKKLLYGMAVDPGRGHVTDFFSVFFLDEPYADFIAKCSFERSDKRQWPVDPIALDFGSRERCLSSLGAALDELRSREIRQAGSVLQVSLQLLLASMRDPESWPILERAATKRVG